MATIDTEIRHKLYDYIRVADDKKLNAIYQLLEDDINQTSEWWKDNAVVKEMDARYQSLENGSDKGLTIEQLETSIQKLRLKKYGK